MQSLVQFSPAPACTGGGGGAPFARMACLRKACCDARPSRAAAHACLSHQVAVEDEAAVEDDRHVAEAGAARAA